MNDDIFRKLEQFVKEQRWEYEFPLTRNTAVEKDLSITGDDAVEFLLAYGKKFDVDVSNFMAADYFDGEGDITLPVIVRMFPNFNLPLTSLYFVLSTRNVGSAVL
jgi:acyl carrier protein